MKHAISLVPVFLLLLSACQQSPDNNGIETNAGVVDSANTGNPVKQLNGENCFAFVNGKDSIRLQLNITSKKVTGNLEYNFAEKDRNTGSLEKAILNGDTLFADYCFQSEGRESVRRVAFILSDSTATEGYGEMIEKKGTMIFKNPANIRFNRSFVLSKISCDKEG